jgi:chromosome partitioning protein
MTASGKIYALVNQKGGVGKTTTAINLGAYLSQFGKKVLIVDLDPQANATSCLGIDKNSVSGGTYEALMGDQPASKLILHSPQLKISILPSSQALAGAEVELVPMLQREIRLKGILEPLATRYDYILIDCPPSLGLLTVNGLISAKDGVIIPIQCEFLALEGLSQLLQTIDRVKTVYPSLSVRGILMTMFDRRTNLSLDVVAEVKQHFPDKIFKAIIPRTIRLAEAPSYGLPVSSYAPDSTGAKAYAALAEEILVVDSGE